MKKLLTLTILLSSTFVLGQRAFVRQNVTTNVYYRVDSVFLTAQVGDTIYLPGGSYQVNSLVLDKRLTIIGAGHYPDSTSATYSTTLSGTIAFVGGSSFSSLTGVAVTGNIYVGTNPANNTVTNLSISRCKTASIILNYDYWNPGNASFISIKENMIYGEVRGCNAQFVSIENNLVNGSVSFFNSNMLTKNNTFLGGIGCPAYVMDNVTNCTFENNIFMMSSPCGAYLGTGNSNTFTNNVFNFSITFPNGTNIGSGNYTSVVFTGFFVNETDFTLDYLSDYHLQSPGTYLGADGTQVGIYGTTQPYKPGAVPFNPHIRFKSIAPSTNPNGDLLINIQVGAQQQ